MLGFIGKWASSKGMVRVPDLSNLTRQEAIVAIENAGLIHSGNSSTTTQNINLNNRVSLQSVNANDLVQYESEISFIYYNYVEVTTTTTTTQGGGGGGGGVTDPTNPTTESTDTTLQTTSPDCDYLDGPTYCLNVDAQGYGDLYQTSWTAGCPVLSLGRSFCGTTQSTTESTQATTESTQATTPACDYVDAPTYCLNVDAQGYGNLYQRSWTPGCPDVSLGRSFCGVPTTQATQATTQATEATTQATQATTPACDYTDGQTYCTNVDSNGYGNLYQRSWTPGCPDVSLGRSFCGVPTTQATQATTQATEATTRATQATTQATEATTRATEATTQATTAGCVYNGQTTIVPCGFNNCVYSNCGEFLGYTST